MKPLDLSGRRFGRLIVVERRENDRFGKARWLCHCDCGGETITRCNTLLKGETRSCGCLHLETVKVNCRTHGAARSPVYHVWSAAKARCENPTDQRYDLYGARGIRMCEAWRQDFAVFARDMGPRPPGYTLERNDTNGHYEPGNCRWATRREQARNTRDNIRFVYDGQALLLCEWAERTGIPESALYYRIRTSGWTVEKALTTPSRGRCWSTKRHIVT